MDKKYYDKDFYVKKIEEAAKKQKVDPSFGKVGNYIQKKIKNERIQKIIKDVKPRYLGEGQKIKLKNEGKLTKKRTRIKKHDKLNKKKQKQFLKRRLLDIKYKTPLRMALKLEIAKIAKKERGIA